MKTNILVKPVNMTPGVSISANEYNVRNYRLRDSLEQASRLMIFMVECDSNNTNAIAIPSDVKKIRRQWQIIKEEFDFGVKYNDFPKGSHELAYKIDLLDGKEIQRIRNVPIKVCITEVFNALRVMLSVDSASTQGYVSLENQEDINRVFEIVDAKFDRWLGDGSLENTGVNAPAFEEIGELVPDIDGGDYAETVEPSRGNPAPKLPDVTDSVS